MNASRLMRSGLTVGGWTMVSRVLGLVRDVVFAQLIGASAAADAFFVAFKIPNFLRRLFAEGAFAQAFVPVLAATREQEGEASMQRLLDAVAARFGLILVAVTAFGVVAAPWIAMAFAPGFADQPAQLQLTGELLRWTFPYLGLISLVAFSGSILNTVGRFSVPAATPIFLNLVLIAAAIWLSPHMDPSVRGLAIGVLVAGVVQLLIQIPPLLAAGCLPVPRWSERHPGVGKILTLMVPALFGVSVSQINLLLDTVLASLLVSGSVSWLYYSDRLVELPLGVIAIAVSTVILPVLSRAFAQSDASTARMTQTWALWVVMLLGWPCALALIVFGEVILSTLFQYGAMQVSDVKQAAASLTAYAIGLPAFMAIKVLAPHYFSRQDTATPVRIGLIAMGANMILNLMFVWSLGHVGLALATSVSAWLNAGLLLRGLSQRGWYTWQRLPWRPMAQLSVALVVMMQCLWITPTADAFSGLTVWARVGQLTALLVFAGVLYLSALWLSGVRYTRVFSPTP
ncbi:MAG: murein biosynthesis integral membrane protein MurJ [Gammaproteobacteria bacterium]|nr:murein biosynthesis integral membrane protein MurJ [Gammaproteobacteria bacterium]